MYIYGKNVAREKLNTDEPIIKAIISKKFKDQDIINSLKQKNIKINFVDPIVLDRKVTGLHQGIILEVEEAKTYTLDELLDQVKDKTNPLIVMLDHLEDPHNFGAIIRTCEALGIDGIIIPNDRSVGITPTVIKTSAGAISYTTIVRVPNLGSTIEKLKNAGFWIVGTDMEGTDYTKIDYNMKTVLIIGNEGKGMSKTLKKTSDFLATIPMTGKINSLNASVSCGIILSHIVASKR